MQDLQATELEKPGNPDDLYPESLSIMRPNPYARSPTINNPTAWNHGWPVINAGRNEVWLHIIVGGAIAMTMIIAITGSI